MIPDDNAEAEGKPGSSEPNSERPPSSGRSRHPRGRRRPRRPVRRPRPVDETASSEAAAAPGHATEEARDSAAAPASKFETTAAPPVPKGRAIHAAIEKVEAIILDLKEVLNELELVMEYLEDAERQQITDEREIEVLRSRLESLHRRVDRPPPRHQQSRPAQRHHDEAPEKNPA